MAKKSQLARKDIINIVKFWRLIETLTPVQEFSGGIAKSIGDLEKILTNKSMNREQKFSTVYKVLLKNGTFENQWPWEVIHANQFQKDDQDYCWLVEGAIIDAESVFKQLREALQVGDISEDSYPNYSVPGNVKLFEILVDKDGKPICESLKISLFFWGAGNLLKFGVQALIEGDRYDKDERPNVSAAEPAKVNKSKYVYPKFNEMVIVLRNWIEQNSEIDSHINSQWLWSLTERVCHACYFPKELVIQSSTFQVRYYRFSNKNLEDTESYDKNELINSFFVNTLAEIESFLEGESFKKITRSPFLEYIKAPIEPKKGFLDLREEEGLRNYSLPLLSPNNYPSGRWPSEHALVFSQQVAVNGAIGNLMMDNQRYIFAVNGPPGTGKTTILRDIIAAVVTERAKKLAKLGKSAFGKKQSIQLNSKEVFFYPLAPELSGTAIVVASSNNGAVENVTLELPKPASISRNAQEYLSDNNLDYYANFAKDFFKTEAWGFISAPIGRKDKCDSLVHKFIWDQMEEHLSNLIKSQSNPMLFFKKACDLFYDAIKSEKELRLFLLDKHSRYKELQKTEQEITRLEAEREKLQNMIPFFQRERANLEAQIRAVQAHEDYQNVYLNYQRKQQELEQWEQNKPGWFSSIMSFGKSHKAWQKQHQALEEELGRLRTRLLSYEQRIEHLRHKLANLDEGRVRQELNRLERELKKQYSRKAELEQEVREFSDIYAYCPDLYLEEDQRKERELLCPWAWSAWLHARERVFLTALMVHRAFVETYPRQMQCNLRLAADWLQGKSLSQEAIQTALDSLCLVIPVVSTTFASMPRLFGGQSPGCIGWLLIDEAGQALPQHAAVALWWAARAVVVGDPLQLEPVFQFCPLLEKLLAEKMGVSDAWQPSKVCAQTLADLSMDVGTIILTKTGDRIRVGVPLIVHRRCNEPMFSISNEIAYDNMMVYGKKHDCKENMQQSFWVHVVSKNHARGKTHWIEEEGEQLQLILTQLIEEEKLDPKDIFLISPFRQVSKELKQIAHKWKLDPKKVGTVHTSQGKEARVVILVLGGHPSMPNAKSFAVMKPNLLNVAVTRAKERLIVIGNKEEWGKQPFFNILAKSL